MPCMGVPGLLTFVASSQGREAEDSLSITVVRCTSGVPKSSFLTEEKRARLKTNPVKVHFAEEVLVSGHSQVRPWSGVETTAHEAGGLPPGAVCWGRWNPQPGGARVGVPWARRRLCAPSGNSLLCMPNVLKLYLENGQTKAFNTEEQRGGRRVLPALCMNVRAGRSSVTPVPPCPQDIILTVKEKLSIRSTEYFALVLEEQYNVSRLHLLHEEELIQQRRTKTEDEPRLPYALQVVEREESHDCRCLFRVCFVPRDPLDLLKEDPVAFEYLYLQSCSDVLQERFAVEMKCSSALRLAALHIQERMYACAQPQKISLKYIEVKFAVDMSLLVSNVSWQEGLGNRELYISNFTTKHERKRHQESHQLPHEEEPELAGTQTEGNLATASANHTLTLQLISAAQLRLNYLQILGELKTYGGKIFNATLMLQDRESYIALLVGAKYGISQIINSKLNIMSTLAEFANISRVELTEESEKVSVVKVYLQDVKVLTLLLESNSAKDLACLIAGYYRLFVDPVTSIFLWPGNKQHVHRVSAEEETSATGSQNEASRCRPEVSLNPGPDGRQPSRRGGVKKYAKTLRKRRSFLQTDYTCQVSFPLAPSASLESMDDVCYYDREPCLALAAPSPTVSSLQDVQGEPGVLETKALGLLTPLRETKSKNPASRVMEMEPETMETKSVIDSRVSSISAIRLRIDPNHKENSGIAPLTSSVASSPANTPHGLNPGSSGPDTAQAGPPQTSSPFQDLNGSGPRELTVELGNSASSLSSADVNPDSVCLTTSPGPHTLAQGDTLELGGAQLETGLGSLFINDMPETAPQDTEPLLSSRDGPKSDECGINSEDMMASLPAEEGQGQLSLEYGREVTNRNDTSLFRDESGKDPGDPKVDGLDILPQTLGVSAPAGGMAASLFLETPVTGTEQTPPSSPTEPQGQSREIPGQACQAQEQKLLAELDFNSDFLLRDQTNSSAFSLEEVKAEPPNHVTGEDTTPGDIPQRVSLNPGPSLPEPLPCPQEEPHLEGSNRFSVPESKGKRPSICLPAEKSFLCFAPESYPKGSASLRTAPSLGFAGVNETGAPRMGMEQCSCQFSYATCFRGLQPETEEEGRDSEAGPTDPLTSPPSAGSRLSLPWRPARAHSCSAELPSRNSHIWPEYCSRALRQLRAAPASIPEGFIQLMESLLELQGILEASWGNGNKHPPEKCTWHFAESRSRLCMGSQKLLSSCQHVIRMDQTPEEMQSAVRDTFQHLVQLAGLCLQLTDCRRCSGHRREAAGNLRDVVHTYHEFVEAARLTCERGYRDLSVKLLARQCTALTAAVFCLTQKFRASTAL
ncbi:hypothetical protein Celaphus_00018443 [Cervus elaphus hippelaphus]|uniref:FERM domain-containing protein n=1 Tax=Cervus elaphus hippelaphus TaxID=46360 RepID=A0A212C4V5_CEREH|nr:hypothetical protein Celaphus_00018443 [Cervus elaphus hippelaphus]